MDQGESEPQQATRSEIRRSWSTVLLVFGALITVWGLVVIANDGPPPLALVGVVMLLAGVFLRRPWDHS